MNIIGGLSIDKDEWAFSFAALRKRRVIPYLDINGKNMNTYNDLKSFITGNIDYINERINYVEKKNCFKTKYLFFRLSREYAGIKETEDTIPLNVGKEEKKITFKDVNFAKKQVENITLDLNDICLHHIVMKYRIGNQEFYKAPIGLWARKMIIKSFIVFAPSSLYDIFCNSFSNIDRRFSGFVYEALADYSVMYNKLRGNISFIVNINNSSTAVSCFRQGHIVYEKAYAFGEKSIVSYIAKRLSFSEELTSDLIFKYSSFCNISFSKEISVKDNNTYVKVSASALNNIIREAVKDKIGIIISDIKKEYSKEPFFISFMGKIVQRGCFYDFIRDTFDIDIKLPLYNRNLSPAFGCAHYGVTRLFEDDGYKNSLWQRIVRIYKGYF